MLVTKDPDLLGKEVPWDEEGLDEAVSAALTRNSAAMCNYAMSF
jgi:hypothetical protein